MIYILNQKKKPHKKIKNITQKCIMVLSQSEVNVL